MLMQHDRLVDDLYPVQEAVFGTGVLIHGESNRGLALPRPTQTMARATATTSQP